MPLAVAAVAILIVVGGVGFFWYYGSPKYLDAGYRPAQPIPYNHKIHAGDNGIDCRYCHTSVEYTAQAAIPPLQTCMNCHSMIRTESDTVKAMTALYVSGEPIKWVRVHDIPDYAYFNHSIHIAKGIGCSSCHGRIDQMEKVEQVKPLSMGWCLECHRNPDQYIRPLDQITNMAWEPGENQAEYARQMKTERDIKPPTDCATCHR
jgi:hypothetical protein